MPPSSAGAVSQTHPDPYAPCSPTQAPDGADTDPTRLLDDSAGHITVPSHRERNSPLANERNLMSDMPTLDIAVLIRLPHELREALRERAESEDRSVASIMRQAARSYLENKTE